MRPKFHELREVAGSDVRSDLGLQRCFWHHAHELFNDLTAFEQEHGRNRADAIFRGDFAVIVDVYFCDRQLPVEFRRQFFENGGDRFAGTAPWGPKVDQHRRGRGGDGRFEILRG